MNKKILFALLGTAAVIAGAILIFPDNKGETAVPAGAPVDASTAASRISYFASHGWEVEELSVKSITIPDVFSESYEDYAAIQDKQGMPLREYAGRDGSLYVYQVKNYSPGDKEMLAELLVCDDTAVASMVYSSDGGSLRMAPGSAVSGSRDR